MNKSNTDPWLVLRTKSRQEKKVESNLKLKHINAYLPTLMEVKQRKDRIIRLEHPLFPGYIFVQPRLDQFQHLRYIPGSCGLLLSGNEPAILPEQDLEGIKIMANSGNKLSIDTKLIPGKLVEVISGPLAGAKGQLTRIKNQRCLVINVPLLGKSVNVEINIENIRAFEF